MISGRCSNGVGYVPKLLRHIIFGFGTRNFGLNEQSYLVASTDIANHLELTLDAGYCSVPIILSNNRGNTPIVDSPYRTQIDRRNRDLRARIATLENGE